MDQQSKVERQVDGCRKILKLNCRPLAFTSNTAFFEKTKRALKLTFLLHFLRGFRRKIFLFLHLLSEQILLSGCFYALFFIRTSNFFFWGWLFLIFFHFWDWNVLNLFLFPRLNLAMSDWVQWKHTISFLSFFFFQAAHIGSHWEVFYKKSILQLC